MFPVLSIHRPDAYGGADVSRHLSSSVAQAARRTQACGSVGLPVSWLSQGSLPPAQLDIGGPCVTGTRPNSHRVTLKLLRHDGRTLETGHDDFMTHDWQVCFEHHDPVAGNKLQMINGTDQDRTVTVRQ